MNDRATQVMHFVKPKAVYESNKLAKRLRRQVGQAIADYDMIQVEHLSSTWMLHLLILN